MAYASWSVVFGEQPSAAKWNILGTNDSSFNDGTGIATGKILPNHLLTAASTLNTWAWDTWTPTWTGLTVGNAVQASKYIQIGKVCFFRVSLIWGTTTSASGAVSFSLPVTATTYPGTATAQHIGNFAGFDVSPGNVYPGPLAWASTTTARIQIALASGTYAQNTDLSATIPVTWTTSDQWFANGFVEVA